MKLHDEGAFQQWSAEVAGSEVGERFREILVAWAETAEEVLDQLTPADAIRASLAATEDRFGWLTSEQIGQMLIILASYWAHGEQLAGGLTPIEARLAEEVLAFKLAEMNAAAAEDA